MTLEEYMERRNGRNKQGAISPAMSTREARVLKLDMKIGGWYKKNKHIEISESELKLLLANLEEFRDKQSQGISKTCNISKNNIEQMLYLIRNVSNHYKIGISNHPGKRLRSLSTACSSKLYLVKFWETQKLAKTLEKELHNKFLDYRLAGEWFNFRDMSERDVIKEIENYIASRL